MTFPLERGTCRKVCRPLRPGQFANIEFAIRAARAAVNRGESPCAVSKAVAEAVSCSPIICEPETLDLLGLIDAVRLSADRVMDALGKIAMDWGIFRKIAPPPKEDAPWWQAFLDTFKIIFKIVDFVLDVISLVDAIWEFLDTVYLMLDAAFRLAQCTQSQLSQS